MSKLTQTDAVLRELRYRPRGVHTFGMRYRLLEDAEARRAA